MRLGTRHPSVLQVCRYLRPGCFEVAIMCKDVRQTVTKTVFEQVQNVLATRNALRRLKLQMSLQTIVLLNKP